MEEHRLKTTAHKLNRLNVDYDIFKNTILLRGSSLSKRQFFLTILLPILVFIIFIIISVLLLLSMERIVFPRIILLLYILPLVLLYYGVKNFFKLRKSKKYQVHLIPGKIILKHKNIDEKVIPIEKIKEMPIYIEENKNNSIGEIYIKNLDLESHLLLSLIDDNPKYFKDDLEHIRNTFLIILGLTKRPETY